MDTQVEPYEPFANVPLRNLIQERLRSRRSRVSPRLPKGGAILGCGRGVAFAPLAEQCEPASLTAIDIDHALVAEARISARAAAPLGRRARAGPAA